MTSELFPIALSAWEVGLCVIPPCQDGSKRPREQWREYQRRRPTRTELERFYADETTGLGVICGEVSGGLEMLEFEGRAVADGLLNEFLERCEIAGLGPLLDRVVTGYSEETPSGGVHLLYRCDDGVEGNLKLARRPGPEPNSVEVLVETRGEGGFTVCAPSHGQVHPTGRAWRMLDGGFETIASVTSEERRDLLAVARSFDQMPRRTVEAPRLGPADRNGDRPGDWFNAHRSWADILEPHGWVALWTHGEETFWRRPGKSHGHSATTNYQGTGLLYVFSSSTVFETEVTYSPFAAWATLEHGGDFVIAARAARDLMPAELRPVPGPPVEVREPDEPPPLDLLAGLRSFAWLDAQVFPPLQYAVPGLIPEGASILAGAPKIGKSWMVLSIAVAVGCGGAAFGQIHVQPRPVLLLAFEDGDRRLQWRSRRLLEGARLPAAVDYITRLEQPGTVIPTIEGWLDRYPDEAPLVILDTLGKVMPLAAIGESSYQRDYRVGSMLKRLFDDRPGSSLIINHHDRKAGAEDFVDMISATHGLGGAVDTILIVTRQRNSTEGVLKVTGRDVPEGEYAVRFEAGSRWVLDGHDLEQAAANAERRRTEGALDERSLTILAYVNENPEGVRPAELALRMGIDKRQIATYLGRLYDSGRITKLSRGLYAPVVPVHSVVPEQEDLGTTGTTGTTPLWDTDKDEPEDDSGTTGTTGTTREEDEEDF